MIRKQTRGRIDSQGNNTSINAEKEITYEQCYSEVENENEEVNEINN